jgi:acetyl-CoA carboxylase biotin carboxyl carrier protein
MSEKEEAKLRRIKELVELMKANDLVELEIADGDSKILLKRPQPIGPTITQISPLPASAITPAIPVEQPAHAQTPAGQQEEGLAGIKSPIVGTFYSAPSPDSQPYVDIGSRVNPDTVVCIVEAMKVMNEIKAETSGTIVEILCETGEAVEYGQVLFKLKPD